MSYVLSTSVLGFDVNSTEQADWNSAILPPMRLSGHLSATEVEHKLLSAEPTFAGDGFVVPSPPGA